MGTYNKIDNVTYHIIEEGIILPQKIIGDYPMWGLGGVCDKDNNFIEASFYDGGWATCGGKYDWQSEAEEYVDSYAVYIGLFFMHWGHFLVDLTGRMHFMQEKAFNKDMKVAYIGEQKPCGNYLEFLHLLGIQDEQLYQVNVPTRFKRVYLPECSNKSCSYYSAQFIRTFESVAKAALKTDCDIKNYDHVYFSRRAFNKAIGTEFGEELIQECLKSCGDEVIYPEQLTLTQQIHIWNHAKSITCMNGTLPLGCVFAYLNKPKLTVLNKTSLPHENLSMFLQMMGQKATMVDIYSEPIEGYPQNIGAGPFLFTITDDFRQYVIERGGNICYSQEQIDDAYSKNIKAYKRAIKGDKEKMIMWASKNIPSPVKKVIHKVLRR